MWFAKKAKWKTKGMLYRKWLAHKLMDDLPDYASRRWDNFDADEALHTFGLARYRPAAVGFGGVGAFLLGCLAGSAVALMLTPKPGPELRTLVKDRTLGYLDKAKQMRTETQASA